MKTFVLNTIRIFKNTSLRNKIIFSSVFMSFLPVMSLYYIYNVSTKAALYESALKTLQAAASQTSMRLDFFIKANINSIEAQGKLSDFNQFLTSLPGEREIFKNKIINTFHSFGMIDRLYISSFALLDINGHNVVDSVEENVGKNKSNFSYFTVPLKTGLPYFSDVLFIEKGELPVVVFSTVIRNDSQKPTGILRVIYNASILQNIVFSDNNIAGESSFPVVIDENMLLLANGHITQIQAKEKLYQLLGSVKEENILKLKNQYRLPLSASIQKSEWKNINKVFESDNSSELSTVQMGSMEVIMAYAKLKTKDWYVLFAQPPKVFLKPVSTQNLVTFIIVATLIIMVFPLIFFISKFLLNPILRLKSTAIQIINGDLNAKATVEAEDEIGQLANAFNDMTEHLKTSYKELEQTNANLEQLVEKRTYALNESLKRIEESNQEIKDSIHYALRIQTSMLPGWDEIKTFLPNSFFLWEPRDLVSGDFYQLYPMGDDDFILVVADCTGHGVPGGFMTMLSISILHRIIQGEKCSDPGSILSRLNKFIKTSLRQDTEEARSDDGLEAAVCYVQPKEKRLLFAGAKFSLILVKNDEIKKIQGDRKSLGYKRVSLDLEFATHQIPIENDATYYLFSDGFLSQIGGKRHFPFGEKRFFELLKKQGSQELESQKENFLQALNDYQGEQERMDDITLIGFRLTA